MSQVDTRGEAGQGSFAYSVASEVGLTPTWVADEESSFDEQPIQPPKIVCPECGSPDNRKNGSIEKDGVRVQRFDCMKCGRKFCDPSVSASLKKPNPHTLDHRVCETET